jgi:hypothetical protein
MESITLFHEIYSTNVLEVYLLVCFVVPVAILLFYMKDVLSSTELRYFLVPLSIRSQKEKLQDLVKVNFMKLEHYGIGVWGIVIACMLITEGYIGYYLMPQEIASWDISGILFLGNLVLFSLILGFSLLITEVMEPIQKVIALLLMKLHNLLSFRICSKVLSYMVKSHQKQTRYFAWIIMLVLSLLIFFGTGIKMQIQSIQ